MLPLISFDFTSTAFWTTKEPSLMEHTKKVVGSCGVRVQKTVVGVLTMKGPGPGTVSVICAHAELTKASHMRLVGGVS